MTSDNADRERTLSDEATHTRATESTRPNAARADKRRQLTGAPVLHPHRMEQASWSSSS